MHRRRPGRRPEDGRGGVAIPAEAPQAAERVPAAPLALPYPRAALRRDARALVWLYDHRRGMTAGEIAAAEGLCAARVRREINRAIGMEPAPEPPSPFEIMPWLRLLPIFPVGSLTPESGCPHQGPLPRGSRLYCVVCHASGLDRPEDPRPGGPGARAADRP